MNELERLVHDMREALPRLRHIEEMLEELTKKPDPTEAKRINTSTKKSK
jgi:hypothetical protein